MLFYYKTFDGEMKRLEQAEPGCWISCIAPEDEEIAGLIEQFDIEPDFFRAALDEEESSHVDSEENSTLIIVDLPVVENTGKSLVYSTKPLGVIITEKNVITICSEENSVLVEFSEGLVKGVQTNLKTRFVLYLMLRIAAKYLQYLKQIYRISDQVELELRRSMRNTELLQFMDIQKSLVYFSSSLKGNELTMEKIMRGRVIKLYEEDQDLLEDVLIEDKQAIDMSITQLNILSNSMDAFASMISNNLNMVMKVLASLTLIVSIPTVISGLYGMNVEGLPYPYFWVTIVIMAVCMFLAYLILKKKAML